MTNEQYNKYTEIKKELADIKWFLSWCGDRYATNTIVPYKFKLITRAKRFLLHRISYISINNEDIEIPVELQRRIVKVIEEYVNEKEQEMKNI